MQRVRDILRKNKETIEPSLLVAHSGEHFWGRRKGFWIDPRLQLTHPSASEATCLKEVTWFSWWLCNGYTGWYDNGCQLPIIIWFPKGTLLQACSIRNNCKINRWNHQWGIKNETGAREIRLQLDQDWQPENARWTHDPIYLLVECNPDSNVSFDVHYDVI